MSASRYLVAAVLILGLASCASDSSATPEPAAVTPEPVAVTLGDVVTEQDLAALRTHFDAGLDTWTEAALDDYTLDIGPETIAVVRVRVVDGDVVTEETVSGSESAVDGWIVPRQVDALFDWVNEQITQLEDDPSLVLDPGECGRHLNVSFDTTLGYPNYFDGLGPCDDGVGMRATVTPG